MGHSAEAESKQTGDVCNSDRIVNNVEILAQSSGDFALTYNFQGIGCIARSSFSSICLGYVLNGRLQLVLALCGRSDISCSWSPRCKYTVLELGQTEPLHERCKPLSLKG